MKNQFYDTLNRNPLEIVCFKQTKSCLLTEKRYTIYGIMVVPVLPHEVKAHWGYFTFSRTQLPILSVYVESTICRDNDLACRGRAHDLCLELSLQFTRCGKEAANSLPVLKPWQNSFKQLELSHCRCHSQLSRSSILNLSCNHFNQSCSSEGKITRALFCFIIKNCQYLTSRTFKQHAYILLHILLFCGVKVETELNISTI